MDGSWKRDELVKGLGGVNLGYNWCIRKYWDFVTMLEETYEIELRKKWMGNSWKKDDLVKKPCGALGTIDV